MKQAVHQIVFTDSGIPQLSGYIRRATDSVRYAFQSCHYTLWGLDAAGDFIAEHFDSSVTDAFNRLQPYAYKADLFKYCLLSVKGGWTIDAGIKMLQSPTELFVAAENPQLLIFRATGLWDASWNCSLALIYAEPGQQAFSTAIDEVVDNCRKRHYGHNPLCPTMSAFGRALAIHRVQANARIGTVVDVKQQDYSRAYQLKPFGLIAARKPRHSKAGDVASIGIKGANNYVQMWQDRTVYAD